MKTMSLSRGAHLFFFAYLGIHLILIYLLDDVFAFAPDEERYLYTFTHLYENYFNSNPQYESGWVAAPKIFLYIALLPAKIISTLGISNLVAIRLESVLLISIVLWLSLGFLRNKLRNQNLWFGYCVLTFFTPSLILWSSLGLRETFLIFFLFTFFFGLMKFQLAPSWKNGLILFASSYSLISTKNYQWLLLMISVAIFLVTRLRNRKQLTSSIILLLYSLLGPLLLFILTTGSDSLDFVLRQNIASVSSRSGESITSLTKEDLSKIDNEIEDSISPAEKNDSISPAEKNDSISPAEKNDSISPAEKNLEESVSIQGNGTLIQLSMLTKSESNLQKVLNYLGLDRVIKEELKSELLDDKNATLQNLASEQNSNVLVPGSLSSPTSLIKPAIRYLFGPFPTGKFGIFQFLTTIESLIWLLLLLTTFLRILRIMSGKVITHDISLPIAILFILGNIVFSALVEVNVGTAFRHRSVLFVPLLVVNFILLSQKEKSIQNK